MPIRLYLCQVGRNEAEILASNAKQLVNYVADSTLSCTQQIRQHQFKYVNISLTCSISNSFSNVSHANRPSVLRPYSVWAQCTLPCRPAVCLLLYLTKSANFGKL